MLLSELILPADLVQMTAHEIEVINSVITKEIITSSQIKKILSQKIQPTLKVIRASHIAQGKRAEAASRGGAGKTGRKGAAKKGKK